MVFCIISSQQQWRNTLTLKSCHSLQLYHCMFKHGLVIKQNKTSSNYSFCCKDITSKMFSLMDKPQFYNCVKVYKFHIFQKQQHSIICLLCISTSFRVLFQKRSKNIFLSFKDIVTIIAMVISHDVVRKHWTLHICKKMLIFA